MTIHARVTAMVPTLLLTGEESRKKPGQVIARIGRQICLFERGVEPPRIGETINAMITRPLFGKIKEGPQEGYWNYERVVALLVRPVTEDDYLLYHEGFECSGSMCQTTASIWRQKQPHVLRWPPQFRDYATATPGRTLIYEAQNVNVGFHGYKGQPKKPGFAYFSNQNGRLRCEGVIDFHDLTHASAVRS